MSEAYDMLLSQRHEAALEAKIEAQAETIARIKAIIRDVLDNYDSGDRMTVNYMVERLQDALEE